MNNIAFSFAGHRFESLQQTANASDEDEGSPEGLP